MQQPVVLGQVFYPIDGTGEIVVRGKDGRELRGSLVPAREITRTFDPDRSPEPALFDLAGEQLEWNCRRESGTNGTVTVTFHPDLNGMYYLVDSPRGSAEVHLITSDGGDVCSFPIDGPPERIRDRADLPQDLPAAIQRLLPSGKELAVHHPV